MSKNIKHQPARKQIVNVNSYTNIVVNLFENDNLLTKVNFPGTREMVKDWVSITEHLDESDMSLLLEDARRRARISLFVDELKQSANPPGKYEDCPRSMKLVDFIQKEWLDKGHNPSKIDRKMAAAYDDRLIRAIENYEYTNGLLPERLRFPKVGNRKSKKEMASSPAPR